MSSAQDFSEKSADTTSTATQNNVAASEQSVLVANVVTGSRNNTVGAGGVDARGNKGTVVMPGGSSNSISSKGDLTIESMDAETIAGAFGLTETVVNQLAALAGGVVQTVAKTNETSTAEMAKAFDRFGTDLSAVSNKAIDSAHPQNDSNKIILAAVVVGGVVWVASILRKKQP